MVFLKPDWHEQIPSTNTALVERLRAGDPVPPGFVLAARRQTAGRGRYNRVWSSNRDLTFSFLLRPGSDALRTLSLPMAIALGVCDLLKEYGLNAHTKWPNDVLVSGRKICGILAERSIGAVIVGVGLNVNMDREEAAQLDKPATSLGLETGSEHSVEDVLRRLLDQLSRWLDAWEDSGFASLRERWTDRCHDVGQPVCIAENETGESKCGLLIGFGDAGQLLLRQDDGRVVEIWAGDM